MVPNSLEIRNTKAGRGLFAAQLSMCKEIHEKFRRFVRDSRCSRCWPAARCWPPRSRPWPWPSGRGQSAAAFASTVSTISKAAKASESLGLRAPLASGAPHFACGSDSGSLEARRSCLSRSRRIASSARLALTAAKPISAGGATRSRAKHHPPFFLSFLLPSGLETAGAQNDFTGPGALLVLKQETI